MNIIILPSILMVVGGLGIVAVLWLSSKRFPTPAPIPRGSEWFSISPDILESELSLKMKELMKRYVKIVLIWTIALYRKISREITIKQLLKKKVRSFLYDHTPATMRHPSDFLHRVKHTEKQPLEKED